MSIKLKLAIAMALSAPSFSALGLGLGEIHTNSSLNQKFDAQIELLSVQPGELENVHVKLAPRETYEQVGIDRPSLLRSLRFSTDRIGQKAVITVKSDKLIREPFLNFLIEVHWPTGKIIREYTVLLDPPIVLTEQNSTPAAVQPVRPAPENRTATRSAPVIAQAKQHYTQNTVATSSAKTQRHSADQYGPVETGESLSKIAAKLRNDSNSIHDMTIALWKSNPDAFIRNNIDLLKAGSTLHVPTSEEIVQLSRAHKQDQKIQIKTDTASETASAEMPVAKGEKKTDIAETGQKEANTDDYRLRLVTGNKETETSITNDKNLSLLELKDQLLLINEKVESYRIQNESLRERVRNLTDKLSNSQQSLPATAAAEAPSQIENSTDLPAQSEQKSSNRQTTEESKKLATIATAQLEQETVNSLDSILDKAWWLAGLLVLGLAAWLGMIRQNKVEFDPHDPELNEVKEPHADDITTGKTKDNTAAKIEDSSEEQTAITPQFKKSTEVDEAPSDFLAEAEQCIAYGHFDLAEKLLKQALQENEDKTVIRYKLIDVYHAKRDIDALNEVIDSIVSAGEEDVDTGAWQRAMEMSLELANKNEPEEDESESYSLTGSSDPVDPDWLFELDETAGTDDLKSDSQKDDTDTPKLKVVAGRQK
mgnify:CR=1 FL=1